ncbi:MAG: hypothetical protein ABIN57_11600 [Chitinophagaceae bacterium]
MKKYIFTFLVLVAIIACNKEKFQTKPTLKVLSSNTKKVPLSGTLSVKLEFTDKEGDVSDSLLVIRQRINKRMPVTLKALPYKIPDFPKTTKGEINIFMDYYGDLTLQLDAIRIPGSNPSRNEPDTMNIKFVAKDKGGHYSDTASLNNIIIIR